MPKSAAVTPMNRLFNRLRQRIKEVKAQIESLETKVELWEQVEAELVKRHSDPTLQFVLNFYDAECIGEIETEEMPRVGPTEAVRQIFAPPGTRLTTAEVRDLLEDMRQRGEIETQAKLFDSDRTQKILRELVKQNFLVKELKLEGRLSIQVYAKRVEE